MFLSIAEIIQVIKSVPGGYIVNNDDFFNAANETIPSFRKLGAVMNEDDESVDNDNGTERSCNVSTHEICCNVPGCDEFFDSPAAFQTHFNNLHRFICIECRRSLPTAHLLDLHISERHDSFFNAQVERGQALMYRCLLEQCDGRLKTPKERKDHCIQIHKFPGNFRFDNFGGCSQKTGNKKKLQVAATSSTVHMDLDEPGEKPLALKTASFGHRKERGFAPTKKTHKKLPAAADNLQEMKEALANIN